VEWGEDKEKELESKIDFTSSRELAKNFETSEKEIEDKLEELGFRTIENFTGESSDSESLNLSYEISDLERRKLQGLFGEKVAVFVKGKMESFIQESLPESWSLHQGVKLTTSGVNKKSLWFGDKNTLEKGFDISDSTVRHRNLPKDKIKEKVRKRHFYASEELFQKFQEHRIPSIDEVFYAVKKTKDTKKREYQMVNSEASSFSQQETTEIDLEEVEDFKVVGVEIKTTENRAESLLSSLQREVRDKAKESPYVDLYSLKVEYEKESREIPEEVDIRMKKLS
jgi:hypothetical protein